MQVRDMSVSSAHREVLSKASIAIGGSLLFVAGFTVATARGVLDPGQFAGRLAASLDDERVARYVGDRLTDVVSLILSGADTPDSGELLLDGEPVTVPSPIAAQQLGIATAYQDLALAPELAAAQNLFLVAGASPVAGTVRIASYGAAHSLNAAISRSRSSYCRSSGTSGCRSR